jgi:DNA polymerase-1
VVDTIRRSEHVTIDTETTGLGPCRDRVRLLQLATDSGVYIIDCFHVNPSSLWPALSGKELVFHNAHFDVRFLRPQGFDFSTVIIRDTMILSALLTAGDFLQRNSLEALAERYLGYSLNKKHQKADWRGELTPDMLDYAAQDVVATRDVYELLQRDIDAAGLRKVADLEHRCLLAVLWMSISGIGFDQEAWLRLADKAEQEAEAFEKQLTTLAPPKPPPDALRQLLVALGLKKPPKKLPKKPAKVKPADLVWNWDSNDQLIAAFHLLGINLKSTGEEALADVNHPFADALRGYRASAKLAGTYGRKWIDYIGADGRIRCDWKQTGTKTGRMACGNPNLQNLPKDPAYRERFNAPPGRLIIKADLSQIELRIAAKVAREQAMIDAFVRGEDLHKLTAQQLTQKTEVTPKERSLAKPINFGLIYGLSAPALARKAKVEYGVEMSEKQAEKYRAAWFAAWPGISRWHSQLKGHRWQQMLGRKAAQTRTLTGRRTIVSKDLWYGARANFIVQGLSDSGCS